MGTENRIKLNPYQEKFLLSKKRYPALIAGIGTGKTFMMLSKAWRFCQQYPNSLGLITRKEFTDLRDSTMRDFTNYFGVTVNSNKDFEFRNGSTIMFRHGSELNVLKNINLSFFGIEQAEEFETDETFVFLRDRLRRQSAPLRQGFIIANAQGHNWIWRLWVNNPGKEFDCYQATTFDNKHNLPPDFIEDLREMEISAPNHYKQYILNQHDVVESDDLLLSSDDISVSLGISVLGAPSGSILSLDVARFGNDKNVLTKLEGRGSHRYEMTHIEDWGGVDLMSTTGRVMNAIHELKPGAVVVDEDGLGGGVVDRLRELKVPCIGFRGGLPAINDKKYFNLRSQGYCETADLMRKGYLKILDDEELKNELLSIKFSYDSKGRKKIETKDEMRKRGLKSPNRADSLMQAVTYRSRITRTVSSSNLPRVAVGTQRSLFRQQQRRRVLL